MLHLPTGPEAGRDYQRIFATRRNFEARSRARRRVRSRCRSICLLQCGSLFCFDRSRHRAGWIVWLPNWISIDGWVDGSIGRSVGPLPKGAREGSNDAAGCCACDLEIPFEGDRRLGHDLEIDRQLESGSPPPSNPNSSLWPRRLFGQATQTCTRPQRRPQLPASSHRRTSAPSPRGMFR
jgi:hypothetical protein